MDARVTDTDRRHRGRNWALFAALLALVLLFYVLTIVRFGGTLS